MWAKIKAWFKHSETIFWARFQVLMGLVMAVLPTLTPIQWFDAALTKTQRFVLAATAIGNGLWTEYLRRRNDPMSPSQPDAPVAPIPQPPPTVIPAVPPKP